MFYCPEIYEGFLSVKKGPCFLFELNYVSPYLYCDLCPRLINMSAVAHYSAFIWQRKLDVYKTHRRRSQRSFRKNIAVKANPCRRIPQPLRSQLPPVTFKSFCNKLKPS